MGVVFRAVDTKLQRPVAIKFLPHSWPSRRAPALQARSRDSLVTQSSAHSDGVRRRRLRRAAITWSASSSTAERCRSGCAATTARGGRLSICSSASPMGSPPLMQPASCIATSSPRTSWSPKTVTGSWRISVWRNRSSAPLTTWRPLCRIKPVREWWSARLRICRPNRRPANRWTPEAMSSRSASCSMKH